MVQNVIGTIVHHDVFRRRWNWSRTHNILLDLLHQYFALLQRRICLILCNFLAFPRNVNAAGIIIAATITVVLVPYSLDPGVT